MYTFLRMKKISKISSTLSLRHSLHGRKVYVYGEVALAGLEQWMNDFVLAYSLVRVTETSENRKRELFAPAASCPA